MIAALHLKKLRLEKNYTQEYLAIELKVSQKTYSNLENGQSKITLDQIQELSKIYKIEIIALLSRLFDIDDNTIKQVESMKENTSDREFLEGMNLNLPIQLLQASKERIEDLKEIISLKNEKIAELESKLARS